MTLDFWVSPSRCRILLLPALISPYLFSTLSRVGVFIDNGTGRILPWNQMRRLRVQRRWKIFMTCGWPMTNSPYNLLSRTTVCDFPGTIIIDRREWYWPLCDRVKRRQVTEPLFAATAAAWEVPYLAWEQWTTRSRKGDAELEPNFQGEGS